MFYFLMNLLSENPSGGPEMFGFICDCLIIGTVVYQIIQKVLDKRK